MRESTYETLLFVAYTVFYNICRVSLSYLKDLPQLQQLKETLDAITSSLVVAIHSDGPGARKPITRKTSKSPGPGILQLPDEILANIFEISYIDAIHISHACRRFRSLALSIPALWDSISDYATPHMVELYLSRCQNPSLGFRFHAGLSADFYSPKSSFAKSSFMNLVSPKVAAWYNIHVLYDSLEDGHNAITALTEASQSGCFPNLDTLCIHRPMANDAVCLQGSDLETVSSWKLPSLKHLYCRNFYPRSIKAPKLKEFSVSLDPSRHLYWDIHRLLRFLRTIPTIEILSISFHGARAHPVEHQFPDLVQLLNVRRLYIAIYPETDAKLLEELMESLELPNVEFISIEVHFDEMDVVRSPSEWIEAVFRQERETAEGTWTTRKVYQKLERLDVQLFDISLDVFSCDVVFESVPSLRHLSIEAPGMRCPISWELEPSQLENLRVLQLKNCHCPQHKGDDLAKGMGNLKLFESLERVEFLDCPDILKWKKEIEGAYPKEKLLWSTERLSRR